LISSTPAPLVSVRGTVKLTSGPVPTVELLTSIGDIYTLTSSQVSLMDYDTQEVELTGNLMTDRSTGSQQIDVQEITVIVAEEFSSSVSMSSAASSVAMSLAASSTKASVSASKASTPKLIPTQAPTATSSSAAPVSQPTAGMSAEFMARVQKMARVRGSEAWTQQYCSSHIGVCFSVRNDYWYRSFGAQAGTLWHVELNSEDFVDEAAIGTGPLVVDLIGGRLADSIADQQVLVDGEFVVGYRLWTGGRHFEVRAPLALRTSVEFLVQSITAFETPPTP
jgi:hypothetical protein